MLAAIGRFFSKHPFVANATTYGTLLVSAELTQQMLTRKILVSDPSEKRPLDTAAFGRYAILGYVITPPIGFAWYQWLDRTFVGTAGKVVARKVLLDQLLFTPPMMCLFFSSLGYMEGRPNVFEEFKEKFPFTYTLSCCYWIPVQSVNFLLIPNQARLAFIACAAFIWATTICYIKQQKQLKSWKKE